MKLIEMLARELKEWPEGWVAAAQESDGRIAGFWNTPLVFDALKGWDSADESPSYYIALSREVVSVNRQYADDWNAEYVTREQWENARNQLHDSVPAEPIIRTPTLETMLAEWRDLEARAQAAQAEADALFEHAGQCHGEIVVRLAELGWGAPRVPMVSGEPVLDMSDYFNWEEGDRLVIIANEACHGFKIGDEVTVRSLQFDDPENPLSAKSDDDYWFLGPNDAKWISRPSTQP